MSGLFWKYALLLIFLLLLLIVAARLMPQPLADLRDFERLFQPAPGCEAIPCLMGIRAGLPLMEAIALLQGHPWVQAVDLPLIDSNIARVHWTWSGQQPKFIDPQQPGTLHLRYTPYFRRNDDERHWVTGIEVTTHLRFQELHRLLGETRGGSIRYRPKDKTILYDVSYYEIGSRIHTRIETETTCPARLIQYYWLDHTRVSQNEGPPFLLYQPPDRLASMCPSHRLR